MAAPGTSLLEREDGIREHRAGRHELPPKDEVTFHLPLIANAMWTWTITSYYTELIFRPGFLQFTRG